MAKKVPDYQKHVTGQPSSTSDFVKHDCPNKIERWVNGKKEAHSPQVKKEFNAIKGNEEMVPVNIMGSDKCGFCGMSVEDPAMIPCTDSDVKALQYDEKKGQ